MIYFREKGHNAKWHYPSARTLSLLGGTTSPAYESICGLLSLWFWHRESTLGPVPDKDICVRCRRRAVKEMIS